MNHVKNTLKSFNVCRLTELSSWGLDFVSLFVEKHYKTLEPAIHVFYDFFPSLLLKNRTIHGSRVLRKPKGSLKLRQGFLSPRMTARGVSKQLTLFMGRTRQKSSAMRSFSSEQPSFQPNLSWTHYRLLMRIRQSEARAFHEKNIRCRLQEGEQTDD